ncbi:MULTISPECIES: conjugal transfer protein TraO [unclassified Chryseobacterium]|uniref:conjugal transfer protein TraO n=1 Tax=unclassified Chryseobacterium TaxID=2593645 RepID=UPI001E444179|nr:MULTISPECIES: conjugal transfer protein TraO [unclassified Chryseobacterium]
MPLPDFCSQENGAVINNKDQFVYGGGGRLTLETYLGNRFVFFLQGKTKYILGTSMERFRPTIGVGLRYIFKSLFNQ